MKVTGFQRLSNMCEVDIDIFCDGERYTLFYCPIKSILLLFHTLVMILVFRQHMKEGIVLVVRISHSHLILHTTLYAP